MRGAGRPVRRIRLIRPIGPIRRIHSNEMTPMNSMARRSLPFLLAALVAAGSACPAAHFSSILAVPAPGAVTVDGDLGEWDLSAAIESAYDPALADCFGATLAVMYDADALYVGGRVSDLTPLVNAHDPLHDASHACDGDAMEIELIPGGLRDLEPGAGRPRPPVRAVHLVLWHFSGRQEVCAALRHGTSDASLTILTGSQAPVAFGRIPGGYTVEARLPWNLLGDKTPPPRLGDEIPFTVRWHWGTPDGSRSVVTLSEIRREGGFYEPSPQGWGVLRFVSETDRNNRPPLSASSLTEPLSLTVFPADSQARQLSAAIFSAEGGQLLRTLPVFSLSGDTGDQGVTMRWDGLDDDGQPLPPGRYLLKFLTHRGVGTRWVTSVHNAGTPPWKTDDGRGSWGGDHGPPIGAASDAHRVYLIWRFAEAGFALIAVDPNLRAVDRAQKLWGQRTYLDVGFLNCAVAANGEYVFTLQDGFRYGDHKREGASCIAGVLLWNPESGRAMNFPFGKRALEVASGHAEPSARGLAVAGDVAYVSLEHQERIVAFNWKTGEKQGEFAVPSPRGLAAETDGRLVVVSGKALVRLHPADGRQETIAEGLSDPVAVAVDRDGNLYVSDRGSAMQVQVFTRSGRPLRSIGVPGGRPAVGRYDPEGMYQPGGLTVDAQGKLWVAETDDSPRRISVWDAKEGKLLGDLLGPGAYAVMGAADLRNPSWVTTHRTLFDVTYETGRVTTLATLLRLQPEAGEIGLDRQDRDVQFRHVRGQTYLCSSGRGIVGVFRFDTNTLIGRPVAAILGGNPGPKVVGAFGEEAFPPEERAAFRKVWGAPMVVWTDGNLDGRVQVSELAGGEPPVGRHGLYWGAYVDDDLTIWSAVRNRTGHVLKIPVEEWLPGGIPRYPPPERHQLLFTTQYKDEIHSVMPSADGRGVYVIEQGRDAEAISRYALDGRREWAYRKTWVHFARTSPMFQPGYVIGALKFIGRAPLSDGIELVAVNGYHGQFNLLTEDGLWVTALGRDKRTGPVMGSDTYFVENFSGFFFRHPETGRYYLLAGETDTRISEVVGLDTVQRGEMSFDHTEKDHAQSVVVARRGTAKTAPARPRHLKVPRCSGWNEVRPEADLDAGGGRSARVGLGYDDRCFYAVFDVTDDSPLRNAGDDPALLFKTGDSVNLHLLPQPGHPLRVLATVVEDRPVVVLYEPSARPGVGKAPRTFASPVSTLVFDRVLVLRDARVNVERTPSGYRLRLALPWSEVGLSPPVGGTLQGDVGVLFSNPGGNVTTRRAYVFHTDTQITEDIPTEARLEPWTWGTLEFGS